MRRRSVIAFAVIIGIVTALLPSFGTAGPSNTTDSAAAADRANFSAGYIISDAQFYLPNAMTVTQVQSFLNSKVGTCRSGYTCLKDYSQWTTAKAADRYCAGFGALRLTAAEIIEGVGRSCGISSKAMLVLLEKEQGLVSDTWPTDRQYRSATGFGCPDTADCDATYYGFFNQVYHAARQFKNYQANPTNWRYQPGRSNYIQWNPNAGCGGSNVFIQNSATAGLYIYTPYQPNAAALNNLYGTGDSCSAYGNRNFWRMYTDWFGSTDALPVTGGIGEYYEAKGGASGSGLGFPTGPQQLADASVPGWLQRFQNGAIYWSPVGGGRIIAGGIGIAYEAAGGSSGTGLGFPTGEQFALNDAQGGWAQEFQWGRAYWTPAGGTQFVGGGIGELYRSLGGTTSSLGYPTGGAAQIEGGWNQNFIGGTIFWSGATGGRVVSGNLLARYRELGGPGGSGLGFPIAAPAAAGSGTRQQFQFGWLYESAVTGAWVMQGGIGESYAAWGGAATSGLGLPIGRQRPLGAGWVEPFQIGSVYWSPRYGSQRVQGGIGDLYSGLGGPTGSGLGYPTSEQLSDNGTWRQSFEYGVITFTGSAGATVQYSTAARTSYMAAGGDLGPLGAATAARASTGVGDGWVERYSGGSLYGSSTLGIHRVAGGIAQAFDAAGGPGGSGLGHPVSEGFPLLDTYGGWMQRFEQGAIYWTPTSGGQIVRGALARGYDMDGGPSAELIGYPLAPSTSASGVEQQRFGYGTAIWSSDTGYRVAAGGIGAAWSSAGGTGAGLGLPTSAQTPAGAGGWQQSFQNGWIYWGPRQGAQIVNGGIGQFFAAAGGPAGTYLGYPTGPSREIPGGWYQQFETGRIYWTPGSGSVIVGGGIADSYAAAGAYNSAIGLPVGAQVPMGDGGWSQQFASGRIYWHPATRGRVVAGGIGERYTWLGHASGSRLGYPSGDQTDLASGNWVQYFQYGRINWVAGSGAQVTVY